MTVNRKCCSSEYDFRKPPRSGKHRRRGNQPPALSDLIRINGWTITKVKKVMRGKPVYDTFGSPPSLRQEAPMD